MGTASKRSKRVSFGSSNSSEDDSFGDDDLIFSSKRQKQGGSDDIGSDNSDGSIDGESQSDDEEEGDVGGAEQDWKNVDEEMVELTKQIQHINNTEQDIVKSLMRHKDEDSLKGQAVKNQKELWDKTLELRFLLQKGFSSSNKLPKEPVRSSFCHLNSVVNQAYLDLISSSKKTLGCMLELHEALLENNPSILQGTDDQGDNKRHVVINDADNYLDNNSDDEWLQLHRMRCRMMEFRNKSIDKWQRKTEATYGAAAFKGKLHAFNQNVSEQVADYMRDPSQMIKRMQLRRNSVGTFGRFAKELDGGEEEFAKDFNDDKEEHGNIKDTNDDGDPELLDDSEFYQQLLKEFLESCDLVSSEAAFYALRKLQPKKRKQVDRRASKSRKIRYHVHEKLANFMAPVPVVLPEMAPKLFQNLFGMGN